MVETKAEKFLVEPKMRKETDDEEVKSKTKAAVTWCKHASDDHENGNGGKPWTYLLIPHDAVAGNMTMSGLVATFTVK